MPKALRINHRPLRTRTAMHYLLRCDQRLCSHQPGHGTFTCCADCEIKSSAPVCAWPLCSGAVSVLSCRFWMSPAPENMGSSRISHNSGFACVIYGFMLLPGTPVLIRVLPALGYLGSTTPMLSSQLQPLSGCTLGSLPAVFSRNSSELRFPVDTSSPSCLQSPRKRE